MPAAGIIKIARIIRGRKYGIRCWIYIANRLIKSNDLGSLQKPFKKFHFAISGQQFLAWAFSDQKSDGEEEVLEDAKTRKRWFSVTSFDYNRA